MRRQNIHFLFKWVGRLSSLLILLIFSGAIFLDQASAHKPAAFTPAPADIQVFAPLSGFSITSPIQVNAVINQTSSGPYWLELFARDGILLYRQVWAPAAAEPTPLFTSLDFEISAVESQDARLVVTQLDAFHRPQAVNSIDLLLQPNAVLESPTNQLTDNQDHLLQAITIESPRPGSKTDTGTVLVSGFRFTPHPFLSSRPQLFTQLVSEDGRTVGQRIASLADAEAPDGGATGYYFTAEIPYKISTPTRVRLLVFEDGSPHSPYTHLASLELELYPEVKALTLR